MTNTNIMRLLGLIAILCIIPFAHLAYAATLPISDLTATAQSGGSIRLDWSYPDADTTLIDIVRADDAGFTTNVVTLLDDEPGLPVTYTDSSAVDGSTYFYKIVQDNAVDSNTASATADGTGPTITPVNIISSNANPSLGVVGDTITVTITGGEALSNVAGTIAGESATIANTVGDTWTASITLSGNEPEGLTAFSISAEDSVGNITTVTATTDATSVTIDFPEPTGVITSPLSGNIEPQTIPITVQFSEPVTGFDVSDIVVTNGEAFDFVAVDPDTYTFSVHPANSNILVTADIPASAAQSIATGLNSLPASFSIQVQLLATSGNWCTGDCIPPTIGLDSNGRRMVDWPVIYHTSTVDFRQLAEYFHTPMNDFTVNVGDINTLMFVVYDNSGFDAIRQIGLSIGVPFSGTFNDGAAQLRWYAAPPGQTVGDNTSYIEETDQNNVFELKSFHTERVECNPHTTGNDNCMAVTIKYVFREAPKDTAIRLDIWDQNRNAFQHVLNEGVTVKGDSMNGPHVFSAMGSNGYMYTLTTTNDFATDQNGDRWSLADGFWSKDLKPVVNALDDAKELAKHSEADKATAIFDGSKLLKTVPAVKDFIPEHYDRLHDPVPNMIKAYIDYAKKQAGHS